MDMYFLVHLYSVDQDVDCGLWNVDLLLFSCSVKLLDIGKNGTRSPIH